MADQMVLATQQWLNETYGDDSRFNKVTEDGLTGWETIYGLIRALQIEEGIEETSDTFGNQTYSLFEDVVQGTTSNIVYIIQGGLWCKGYSPGGLTGYYGQGTYSAVKELKSDMGFPSASGNMNRDVMRGLLNMSAYVLTGEETDYKVKVREIQQKLNYDYYDYYRICPCDGVYNRDMNKMMIYALQKELGISSSDATGTWGTRTTSLCKAISYGIGDSSNIVLLARYASVCNGYDIDITTTTYSSTFDDVLEQFADDLLLPKTKNLLNYTIIKSLLSSNGDPDRSAIGCDTATKLSTDQIQTLVDEGYEYVGRYLTNTPNGTLDKCLTRTEVENILNAGLKIFYIFQESNNTASAFTSSKGTSQATSAIDAMNNLGLPSYAIAYFAVDCDPQDSEITSYIIPYFNAVFAKFEEENTNYRIGVYGTRNVCLQLKEQYGNSIHLFVSDASYGYSGNLGFVMPGNWSFDQFCTDITIGSGDGAVSIDKVAVSGVDTANYGSLRDISDDTDENEDDMIIYVPDSSDKKHKGRLYVNISEDGLHVYSKIICFDSDDYKGADEKYAYPLDKYLAYTIPQYAMYVNIGIIMQESNTDDKDEYMSYLIKYLNEDIGKICYGYIPAHSEYNDGNALYSPSLSSQVLQDIENYDNQREFTNYVVDSTHTKLISSTRVSFDESLCVIYTLNGETELYNYSAELQETLSSETKIAISVCDTGDTHNEMVGIKRIYDENNEEWYDPSLDGKSTFVDYKLEKGSLPSNRVVNN